MRGDDKPFTNIVLVTYPPCTRLSNVLPSLFGEHSNTPLLRPSGLCGVRSSQVPGTYHQIVTVPLVPNWVGLEHREGAGLPTPEQEGSAWTGSTDVDVPDER